MMTLDTVRQALRSTDPFTEMDRIVRAELATGRKVQEVFDALYPMAVPVLGSPDLNPLSAEALQGTLDALTGDCDPDQCYEDPPSYILPKQSAVENLPRWAQVAFGTRIARRLLPLAKKDGFDLPEEIPTTVASILRAAERSAATTVPVPEDKHTLLLLLGAVGPETKARSAGDIFLAVVAAASASRAENPAGRIMDLIVDSQNIAESILDTEEAYTTLRRQIAKDLTRLHELAIQKAWTDDSPVNPDVLGPIWSDGTPWWWPADPDVPHRNEFVATALVKDDTLPRHVVDEMLNVFNAINRYYIARTGQRLTLEGDMPLLLAALVPEGSVT